MENVASENFFREAAKLDPENTDYLASIAAAEKSLKSTNAQGATPSAGLAAGGALKVSANGGTLFFQVDQITGTGTCDMTGAGGFEGTPIPASVVGGGKYTLTLTATTAELVLTPKIGDPFTYNGHGVEQGIEGTWAGTW